MTISYAEFERCANEISSVSVKNYDNWILRQATCGSSVECYLVKQKYTSRLVNSTKENFLWEYHVLYSRTYAVPVLYFHVCKADGSPLLIEQVVSEIKNFSNAIPAVDNIWNFISQDEHPYLRRPFYMLHPCKTKSFLPKSSPNVVVCWLTVIGSILNIEIKPCYYSSSIPGSLVAQRKKCHVVAAFDYNPNTNMVYKFNFKNANLENRNISALTADDINRLNPDVILLSPPCQPFSRQGRRDDMSDERNESLLHLLQLIPSLENSLRYMLLENVKGFEVSSTRDALRSTLHSAGFQCREFLLSPTQLGVRNSRTRYYLLARRGVHQVHSADKNEPEIYETLEEIERVVSGEEINRHRVYKKIGDYLDVGMDDERWTEYSVLPEKVKKYRDVMDVVDAQSDRSCCFTGAYGRYFEGTGSLLQRDAGDLRYFTPTEIARLMAFPEPFSFPETVTRKQRYKMLGNSVNVHVVSILISYLLEDSEYF